MKAGRWLGTELGCSTRRAYGTLELTVVLKGSAS
jgi:hypothetical protein